MKASEYKDDHYFFTGKVSDITRNLSFMGFGVIWILIGGLDTFKSGDIDNEFIIIMVLLATTLVLDLVQYSYQAILTYFCFRKFSKEEKKKGTISDDYDYSVKYNWASYALNILKVLVMIVAYILLIIHLFKLIF